ncbi:nucleotide cyclase [Dunaliella salina]|uniref:Nucleotide cyclase n=1 Tax=Dunaliella salina TaxID=3046 RepID=A0ABQ7GPE1_DUNSA|nr:nucleotide cyclase [Dunaliella salina]|eukprot:KAF5836475.1 nucleotide cyclase [Dunaliella salina]
MCRAKLRVPLTALGGPPSFTNGDSKQMYRFVPRSYQSKDDPELGKDLSRELEDVLRYGVEVAQVLVSGHTSGNGMRISECTREQGSALPLAMLEALQAEHGPGMADLLLECCSLEARKRPRFSEIHKRLDAMGHQAIHNAQLYHRTAPSDRVKQPADELLYELFPVKVAEALKAGRLPDPEPFPEISLFFCDICGFTSICSQLSPTEVMDMLHRLYTRFDALAQELQLFKELGCIHIRAGIHAGAVMGAVVGTLNRRFCLFGDCVNVSTSVIDYLDA